MTQILPGSATVLCCTIVLLASSSSWAALFGADNGTLRRIVEIDPTTGAILRSFPTPDQSYGSLGMSGAEGGSVLLWVTPTGETSEARLTRIDPISGSVLGYVDPGFPMQTGLTAQVIDGHRYVFGLTVDRTIVGQIDDDPASLFEIPAVYGIARGALGGDDYGRAFVFAVTEKGENRIYEFGFGPDYPVLRSYASPFVVTGLAFDGRYLYASNASTLATLEPDTGEVVSSVQVSGAAALVALGVAIPEPSATLVIGAAAALTAMRRRRRLC